MNALEGTAAMPAAPVEFRGRPDHDSASPADLARLNVLRDGLARRQREIPEGLLAGPDDEGLLARIRRLPGCGYHRVERELLAEMLPTLLATIRPRGLIHLLPHEADGMPAVLEELSRRDMMVDYVAVAPSTATRDAVRRAHDARAVRSASRVSADPMLDVPLPQGFARPRLALCLSNTLGCYSRLGAIRTLRAIRAVLVPGDAILLGLDLRNDVQALEMAFNDTAGVLASYHKRVLAEASRELDANFQLDRFDFRAVYDTERRRLEMRLVARQAHEVTVPGLGTLALRRGESIRTATSATFSRGSIAGMLTGVGLDLRWWAPDPREGFALALASPSL